MEDRRNFNEKAPFYLHVKRTYVEEIDLIPSNRSWKSDERSTNEAPKPTHRNYSRFPELNYVSFSRDPLVDGGENVGNQLVPSSNTPRLSILTLDLDDQTLTDPFLNSQTQFQVRNREFRLPKTAQNTQRLALMPPEQIQNTHNARQNGLESFETLRDEVLNVETLGDEVPNVETLRDEVPNVETLRDEVPNVATFRDEVPNVETLRDEVPNVETLRDKAPNVEKQVYNRVEPGNRNETAQELALSLLKTAKRGKKSLEIGLKNVDELVPNLELTIPEMEPQNQLKTTPKTPFQLPEMKIKIGGKENKLEKFDAFIKQLELNVPDEISSNSIEVPSEKTADVSQNGTVFQEPEPNIYNTNESADRNVPTARSVPEVVPDTATVPELKSVPELTSVLAGKNADRNVSTSLSVPEVASDTATVPELNSVPELPSVLAGKNEGASVCLEVTSGVETEAAQRVPDVVRVFRNRSFECEKELYSAKSALKRHIREFEAQRPASLRLGLSKRQKVPQLHRQLN